MAEIGNLEAIYGGPIRKRPKEAPVPPETQLRAAMREAGIEPPDVVVFDGKLHRFSTSHQKKNDHGWYVAFGDGTPAGSFGDWGTADEHKWCADIGRPLSEMELTQQRRRMEEARALRETEAQARREAAKEACLSIWEGAPEAPHDHPYLARKRVKSHGLRITQDGRLVLPMYGPDGSLSSLQYIDASGEKRYHPGGATKNCYMILGTLAQDTKTYIVEGYATGATVHEATGRPVVIAFSAGNLPGVTTMLRTGLPQGELVIVADNDASGTGERYARQAAEEAQAHMICIPERGDANDWALAGNDLKALLEPQEQTWLLPMSSFAQEPAPIRWLIKHWLQRDALCMVHGPSGGGKTFFVLDMALSLAAGMTSWCGLSTQPCPVAYLAGEGHHGLRARVTAWCQARGIDPTTLRGWISSSGCDLNTLPGLQQAASTLRLLPEPPGLIIIDTLHRFLLGDENSAQDAKTMLDSCAALQQEFGATVLLVHHTGVSDEAQHRARGSSAWRGALDIEISVTPAKGTGPITVCQRKSKDAAQADPLAFDLTEVTIEGWADEDGEPVTSAVLTQTEFHAAAKHEKADQKLLRHRSEWADAWKQAGAEVDTEGRPYVSRGAVLSYLVETLGYSQTGAEKAIRPSIHTKLIGYLVNSKSISWTGDGWVVMAPEWATRLLLAQQVAE